jgi:predicted secreted protein
MAAVKNAKGVKLLLKVGDGGSPTENFATYCSVNAARGITFTAAANEINIPDCADPEKIAWLAREKSSLSVGVTGAGMLNTPDLGAFYDWLTSEDSRNVQMVVDVPGADGGVTFSGAFHLTEFAVTGDVGNRIQVSITLASDGEVVKGVNS